MQTIEARLINFYDAVIANDGIAVQQILAENLLNNSKFTTKMITGMLVIAIEEGSNLAGQAILAHNATAEDKINNKHLNSIINLAAKKSMLKPIGITLN